MKTFSIIVLLLFVILCFVIMPALYLLQINNYFNSAGHCKRKQIKNNIKKIKHGIRQFSKDGHGYLSVSSYSLKQPEIKQYFLDHGFMIDESNGLIIWNKNYYDCYHDKVGTLLQKGKN